MTPPVCKKITMTDGSFSCSLPKHDHRTQGMACACDVAQLYACFDAIAWLQRQKGSRSAIWRACHRGDWMVWLLVHLVSGQAEHRRLVACVADCVREAAWPYVAESEGETAMAIALCDHIVNEYLEGRADTDDVAAAEMMVVEARVAISASWYRATSPMRAAAWAARATAAVAAGITMPTVGWAERAVAGSSFCASVVGSSVLRRCAYCVRRHYPDPPKGRLLRAARQLKKWPK